MAILALAILVTMGRPVFYVAKRAGLHGKPFSIVKFRSMRPAPSQGGTHHSGDDDPRITSVGRFLRRTKLDELPQLVNVLIGKMSVVGPRPETIHYTDLYTEKERLILSVRPGLTDYASLQFADLGALLSGGDPDEAYLKYVWKPKMELRMKYVRERSFGGDLTIITKTILIVIFPPRDNG